MERGLRSKLTNYGDADFSLFLRRAFIKAAGYSDEALDRPIVGVSNTYSDYNPCHHNVPGLIEAAKRGALLAGALPMVFPTMSLHESFAHPTSMYLRNLMAMETEELIRSHPMDAVVLIGGCDKTLPAQLMAAVSADVPTIFLPTGPMSLGSYKGEALGACTDCRRYWGEFRGGRISRSEIDEINDKLVASVGTCAVMGTASTMACLVEAMGLCLPLAGSAPATSAERMRLAERTGAVAVRLAKAGGPRTGEIVTAPSLANALVVLQATGGSTNAVVHLAAIAGRAGLRMDAEALNEAGRRIPVLVDLKPSGTRYMEQFHNAGGVPRLLKEIAGELTADLPTVHGVTIADMVSAATDVPGQTVIRGRSDPVSSGGALSILRGNLAPRGALIKRSAATPNLLRHEGRAVVFHSLADMAQRIDRDDLDVDVDDVLVLRNAGPRGAPGMPEAGYIPIPAKLVGKGVKDMVRISDARMSGTAFGTIILHVAPEAAAGGPLAIVKDGDRIGLDVDGGRIDLLIDDAEWATRMAALAQNDSPPERGYERLYFDRVMQAHEGADFDFLQP